MSETAFSRSGASAPASDGPITLLTDSNSSEGFEELARPYMPVLVLNADGFVQHITKAARQLLQYRSEQAFDPYFFTHIHGKNLHRVMRDLALMVKRGAERTSWLLRLRTGRDCWRWYCADVTNHLSFDTPVVTVHLSDLHAWQPDE